MKRAVRTLVSLILAALLAAALCACADVDFSSIGGTLRPDEHKSAAAPDIPDGYVSAGEHMQKGGFMDYFDYCRYTYPENCTLFDNNAAYTALKPADEKTDEAASMRALFESFRGYMEAVDRLSEYDFDPACVSAGDLYRFQKIGSRSDLPDNPLGKTDSIDGYSLWFFDREASTLYYLHAKT